MSHHPSHSQAPHLADREQQADWFARVREAHQRETIEDYVELIADLIAAHGEARLGELAARLGVAEPTANKVIHRLEAEGYVTSPPYRAIFLTQAGEDLAAHCKRRHSIVVEFLTTLGIPREAAEYDAEGIEHHISDVTLKAFEAYAKGEE